MLLRSNRNPVRAAFTLVEMLVVIAIISILLGILLPAIQLVKIRGQVAKAQNDISQLTNAIAKFKSDYGVSFVPSTFVIKRQYQLNGSNPRDEAYFGYLKQVWPRLASSGAIPEFAPIDTGGQGTRLSGNQCLVFFLGGYINTNNQADPLLGFSDSSTQPFRNTGKRQPASFEIQQNRLNFFPPRANQYPSLFDPWGQPYIYFTALYGNDYPTQKIAPNTITAANKVIALNYLDVGEVQLATFPFIESTTPSLKFFNPNSCQIISAGPDGANARSLAAQGKSWIGPGGNGGVASGWKPGQGSYGMESPGSDDLSNFWPKQLGAP